MKSSAKEPRRRGENCLIVDGYNILSRAAGAALTKIPDLETARRDMESRLAQYRAVNAEHVIVVYDAHQRHGNGVVEQRGGIEIVFTDAGETADARIERLVYELRDDFRNITVATSDRAEQQVSFGGGALRIPATELLRRLATTEQYIERQTLENSGSLRRTLADSVRQDIADVLEKWRKK